MRRPGRLCLVLALACAAAAATLGGARTVSAQAEEEEGAEERPRRPPSLFERPGGRREPRRPPSADETAPPDPAPDPTATPEGPPPGERPRQRAEPLPARPRREIPPYERVPIPDRWRIVESLGVNERAYDPYNQSTLKADRPIFGTQDVFFNLAMISDLTVEPRRIPTPVGVQANQSGNTLDIFGDGEQLGVVENLIVSTSLIKGDTVFRPPDYELRFTAVGNVNYQQVETLGVLYADPDDGRRRTDWHVGPQDAFLDVHLWNKSDRYDFDSIRVGIQPFTTDFRGFLFQDNQLGARLFGTFVNNRVQYNLAYFRRLEKDTNSGLNEWDDLRKDDVFAANVYYQDFPVLGFQMQGTAVYNRNREGNEQHFNENDFLQRPAPVGDARGHHYDVVYLGLNADGHIDRLNLTLSGYVALGEDERSPIAGREQDIRAYFGAAEASYDIDWYRLKAFAFYASGDDDPFDGTAGGFDAIFENPQFAGADTSFWQRQSIPFIFGGGVALQGRNAIIPSLRTSKEEGQSNFVHPGILMLGVGADFDLLPELRFETNAAWLNFDDTSSLRLLRNQEEVAREIGWDVSGAIIYRPLFTQNVILRLAGAVLVPGEGVEDLFDARGDMDPFYSVLANLILTY